MIGERDIKDYLKEHNPKKPPAKKKEGSVVPPADKPEDWWERR